MGCRIARGALAKHAPKELTIFPDTMIRVRLKPSVSTEWFSQIWNSGFVRLQIRILGKTAVGLWKVSQDQIGRVVIALPPLAKQHRIVAKVDELMALCDRLETQLTTTQTESRRLVEAVLAEALTAQAEKN
jgi:type I restriction enzyme, S subunit